MFTVDEDGQTRTPLNQGEYSGQGLRKIEVIRHVQELRALSYSVINNLLSGNANLAKDFI